MTTVTVFDSQDRCAEYLNSGAGSLAGAFMHNRHANNDFPKLLGWWGHKKETRFEMGNKLDLSPGIAGYRISNPSVMAVVPIRASLDIFNQTSMEKLRKKSKLLTGYLEYLIKTSYSKPLNTNATNDHPHIDIITPQDQECRGSQLSLYFSSSVELIHKELAKRGVCCDERKPNVLRVAPIPMYNSFEDVWRFHLALHQAINAAMNK